ncbi:hypothetical protein CKO09_05435 [Chromatium weissei]|nr:hypothetical protein [Chromatium weissei]
MEKESLFSEWKNKAPFSKGGWGFENMAHLYFLLGLGFIVFIALAWQIWRLTINWLYPPYCADNLLFTPSQRQLKAALEQAVGNHYRVYGRIRVADVIGLRGRLTRREQENALARLDGLSFDFLLCTPETSALVGAIALVSPSHWPGDLLRQRRLRQICAAAALPLLCIEKRDVYSVTEMTAQIFSMLQLHWLDTVPNEKVVNALNAAPAIMTNDEEWNDRPVIERREPLLSIDHDSVLEPKLTLIVNTAIEINDEMPCVIAEKRSRWRS